MLLACCWLRRARTGGLGHAQIGALRRFRHGGQNVVQVQALLQIWHRVALRDDRQLAVDSFLDDLVVAIEYETGFEFGGTYAGLDLDDDRD